MTKIYEATGAPRQQAPNSLPKPRAAQGLERGLTGLNFLLLGIGAIIGAGIFVMTGTAAANYAGPAIILSFAIAAVACLCAKMQQLVAAGRMRLLEGAANSLIVDCNGLCGVEVKTNDDTLHRLPAEQLMAFFGLHPKLGPIAEWGLELDRRAIKVDTEKFQSSIPGIFAVGDINTYPGKKKLILSGFHEAALAAFAIQHRLNPTKRQFLQYTTTSPLMHERLGVP